ncbi:MAG: EAL domain-containing protein [Methylovulum sp.]|nr:EAL domain-containing protein [Methylovulum sp.]
MACKCRQLPDMPSGAGKILLTFPDELIREHVVTVLNDLGYATEQADELLTVVSDDISQLIRRLCGCQQFSDLEMAAIHAVVLQPAELISFSLLNKLKPLSHWGGLLAADDLIYVLNNRALQIVFQPLVDVVKGEIYGYECLMRGLRADGSIIGPDMLLEQAKKAGLLFNLDRLAREMALQQAVAVQLQGRISINFLPTAIYNPEMCLRDTVLWAEELGIDPARIMFEVVETENVKDFGHLKTILDFYRKKGFKTALDDVGSGYAGLNLLAELTPDLIKIDRCLVQNVDALPIKQSIVAALIAISLANNIEVLAEGVETEAERDYLMAQGVSKMQGYLFGKPNAVPQLQILGV